MVGITGTMLADHMRDFGFSLITSSTIFAIWYASEKTLAIHSIYARRREVFYWTAVIATFALGTSLGDMTADTMDLGYLGSIVLFVVLFAIPFVASWLGKLNIIFVVWFSYIMTRPLGASVVDWLVASAHRGGLGLGTWPVSLVLIILIAVFVIYLTITRFDVPEDFDAKGSGSAMDVNNLQTA
jgi:uncharacterized membrane-anchored protein